MLENLKKHTTTLVIALIIFASSWALLNSDFFRFHDFTQGARIIEMTNALKDGHFPVIWSSNLGYGYGMPLFEFYAPLPYYVGALFYMIGFSLVNSVKLIMLVTSIVTAIAAYLLGKKLFGTTGGWLTSAAITLAPYRAVNLFVRGAISEAWGIMFLPFILLGIIKVIKNEKNGWVLLTGSILALLLSHNLTALVFLPLSIIFGAGYLILEASSNKKVKEKFFLIVLQLAGLYALAVLLSSFYTIPALLEKDFTRLEATILSDYFDYKLHFVGFKQFIQENWGYGGSTYGPMDGISFYLGWGQILGLILSVYLLFKENFVNFLNKLSSSFNKNTIIYFLLMALFGVSILMATNKTVFIWELIPALSFLQFPWRYLSSTIIFLGLIVGSLTLLFPAKPYKYGYSAILLFLMIVLNASFFRPENFTSDLGEYYYSDVNKLRTQMSKTLPDYIPAQIEQKEIEPVALDGQVLYCQVLENCEKDANGQDSFKILENKVQKKLVKINFTTSQAVTFSIANFPGWTANIDEKKVEILESEQGFIKVDVPEGEHLVALSLKNTNVRNMSNLLSIFGLVIFLGMFFWYHKKK